MRYLVDTNVISAVAPSAARRPMQLVEWIESRSESLYLSVVTITEVHAGIAKAHRTGATKKAEALLDWWRTLVHLYEERILPYDGATAQLAGYLIDTSISKGFSPGFADIVIAATAKAHGMTVITRNLKHFADLVAAVDPFAALPP